MVELSVNTLIREEVEVSKRLTGWSGSELGRRAGLTHVTINRLLNPNNISSPSVRTLTKIREAVDRFASEASAAGHLDQALWQKLQDIRARASGLDRPAP